MLLFKTREHDKIESYKDAVYLFLLAELCVELLKTTPTGLPSNTVLFCLVDVIGIVQNICRLYQPLILTIDH